jgi:hypothetical protein
MHQPPTEHIFKRPRRIDQAPVWMKRKGVRQWTGGTQSVSLGLHTLPVLPRSSWLLQASTLASVSAPHPRPPPTFSHTKGGVVARSTPTLLSCLCQGLGVKHSWSSKHQARDPRRALWKDITRSKFSPIHTSTAKLLLRLRLRSAHVGPGGNGGVTVDIGICAGFAPVSSHSRGVRLRGVGGVGGARVWEQ